MKSSLGELLYRADQSISGALNHLKKENRIGKNGPLPSPDKKRKRTLDSYAIHGRAEVEGAENERALEFSHEHFRALLYDWISSDTIAFDELNSDKLGQLLGYLNPRCKGIIPSDATVSRIMAELYDKQLGVVTEPLRSAITKINISFDLWTSKNRLALLGLCAHFINSDGEPVSALLSLPRQRGVHTRPQYGRHFKQYYR